MKRIPSWLYYTVLRLLVFAIPLAILLILGIVWWASVIAAALIGLCLSYIFLSRPRNAVSSDLYEIRHREKPIPSEDDEVEDAVVDSTEAAHADADSRTEASAHADVPVDGPVDESVDGSVDAPVDAPAEHHEAGTKPPTA